MTSEQLLATRATLWRQKAEPLLTLEDAQAWLQQSGLCLFLPRKAQIPAPAPSFVEACLGETNPTPPRTAIETAKGLVARLIEANSALPLNLLGTASDYPDFLVSLEALPFVYALRGDRDWKHAPGTAGANRVSPLITHVWKLVENRGVLTATEIQEELGKELTEAAVLRALHELWSSLRVVPLYQGDGQETLWEPLQSRHQKAMTSGVGMSQITALSVLVSVYLQAVIAAGGDDAESFLSPLASRAKVREVVRGLTATRQLAMIQMETQSLLYVEGSLPEFAEIEKPVEAEAGQKPIRRAHPTSPEGVAAALARKVSGSLPRPAYKRPAASADGVAPARSVGRVPARPGRSLRPTAGSSRPETRKREGAGGAYRPASGASRPAFRPKTAPVERSEPGTGLRADGSPKKARWRDLPGGRPDQKGKPARFGPRKTEGTEKTVGSGPPRRATGSFRPATGAKPSYRPAGASKPPFKSSGPPPEGTPYRAPGAGRSTGAFRPSNAAARSDRPSYGASGRPPSRPATSGGRPAYRSSGARPQGNGSGPPSRSGVGRVAARPEGSRPFFRPRREEGAPVGRTPREGQAGGDRKFTPKPAGGFSSTRPRTGEARPYAPGAGSSTGPEKPPFGYSPASSNRTPTGRAFPRKPGGAKSFGGASPGGRPGFKPDYKPRGSKTTSGPRAGSRPGFGKGGRPGSAPSGRPPAKFKKRPEPAE